MNEPEPDSRGTTPPIEITCQALYAKRQAGQSFLLLDCREPDEHALVAIAGSTLLPLSELAERFPELEPSRDEEIVVHCHHGGRSLRLALWLREQGFSRAVSLAGGIDRWALEIDPALPRY